MKQANLTFLAIILVLVFSFYLLLLHGQTKAENSPPKDSPGTSVLKVAPYQPGGKNYNPQPVPLYGSITVNPQE